MPGNSVQTLYTQRAKLYQFFFIDFLKWGKVLETFFQENAYLHPGMKILDAGCGTGSVTRVLHGLALRKDLDRITFHAFDLTPAMLELFRQWVEKEKVQGIQFRQANVLDLENQLPADWSGYDLIVSSAMLEYIPKEKISQALSNLRRLLGKNGRLLILVTKQTWIAKWTAAKWWKTNLFNREDLEIQLREAGFPTIQKKKLPDSWDSFMMAIEAGVNS
jgi:ubiquinone/menaquinone biosynthesis C-methylase UbiE